MAALQNKLLLILVGLAATFGCGGPSPSAVPAAGPPATCRLRVGSADVTARIAATPEARQKGLSGNVSLGFDDGMLFVFPGPQTPSFWMKDTHISLSIAFITPEGRISDIMEMSPDTEDLHTPHESVIAALEMPDGWFAKHAVKPGDTIALPKDLHIEAAR